MSKLAGTEDTGLILNRPTSQTMMVDGEPWGAPPAARL